MALRSTLSNEQGMAFVDTYSGRRLNRMPRAHCPDILSIDAVFPFALLSSGRAWIHSGDNIVATPAGLNFFNNVHLPMFLAKAGEYYRQYVSIVPNVWVGQLQEIKDVRRIQTKLVEDCRRLAAIRRRVPQGRTIRLQIRISSE